MKQHYAKCDYYTTFFVYVKTRIGTAVSRTIDATPQAPSPPGIDNFLTHLLIFLSPF